MEKYTYNYYTHLYRYVGNYKPRPARNRCCSALALTVAVAVERGRALDR